VEPYAEVTPEELSVRLASQAAPALLDVRELWEHQLCALPGSRLIPTEELPFRLDEIPADGEVVVYCHHGIRSAAVVQWLRARGIPAVNLRGGIDAWALRVDPTFRRY
jgi:rhodanese-related sulfurtransferase